MTLNELSINTRPVGILTSTRGERGGGGGGLLPYIGCIGMCRCEGYGFQTVLISDFGSRIGYHFPFKLINWLKILV